MSDPTANDEDDSDVPRHVAPGGHPAIRATPARRPPSLVDTYGLHCGLLSLASGLVGLAVSLLLWWRGGTREIVHLAEQAEIFSAVIGITLAGVGLASKKKRVRGLAIAALVVNIAILSFVLDNMLSLVRG